MKILINNEKDRQIIAGILVNNGYTVKMEIDCSKSNLITYLIIEK